MKKSICNLCETTGGCVSLGHLPSLKSSCSQIVIFLTDVLVSATSQSYITAASVTWRPICSSGTATHWQTLFLYADLSDLHIAKSYRQANSSHPPLARLLLWRHVLQRRAWLWALICSLCTSASTCGQIWHCLSCCCSRLARPAVAAG